MLQVNSIDDANVICNDMDVLYNAQIVQAFTVDKQMPCRKIMSSIFSSAPFRPAVDIDDPKILLKLLSESPLDALVIYDLENPIAIEIFLRSLQQIPRQRKTYVIATVQNPDRARLEALLPLGLSGVIMKPLSIESVRAKLEDVCKIPSAFALDEFRSHHY